MQSNAITIKIPSIFSVDIDNLILNCMYKVRVFRLAEQIFKENKIRELMLLILIINIII